MVEPKLTCSSGHLLSEDSGAQLPQRSASDRFAAGHPDACITTTATPRLMRRAG
jgi:hypothetical protein